MQIQIINEELVAVPTGVFDYTSGQEMVQTLLAREDEGSTITIDFRRVVAMDSSGIGALITLYKSLPEESPRIKLINPSDEILRLLRTCCLDRFFDITQNNKPLDFY